MGIEATKGESMADKNGKMCRNCSNPTHFGNAKAEREAMGYCSPCFEQWQLNREVELLNEERAEWRYAKDKEAQREQKRAASGQQVSSQGPELTCCSDCRRPLEGLQVFNINPATGRKMKTRVYCELCYERVICGRGRSRETK